MQGSDTRQPSGVPRARRLDATLAVEIDAAERPNRYGFTRNLSESGVLFHSSSRYVVGDRVVVRFPGGPNISIAGMAVEGVVVRAKEDDPDLRTYFPFVTAVRFAQPLAIDVNDRS